jgi:hypothetical protein
MTAGAINMEAASLPAVLDKGKHDILMRTAARFWLFHLSFQPADISFIDFDNLALATHWRKPNGLHCSPDAMAHEPSGFEGDTEGTVKLVRADPLLAGSHEKHGL